MGKGTKQSELGKAATVGKGPDVSLLQEFFDAKPVESVKAGGKTVLSKFNPTCTKGKK